MPLNSGHEYTEDEEIKFVCVLLEKDGFVELQKAAAGRTARVVSTPLLRRAMRNLA
jgi:hypothetical protein